MAYEVFISYSSKDKPIADGICANLEAARLRCWIAPRDIGPGEDWPTAIANAIAASQVMVLVFSHNANMSDEISRELYLAANSKLIIIPFMIENVKPEAGKAYYLGRTHWLDAMNPPTREQIGQLVERVNSFTKPTGTGGQVAPVLSPAVPSDLRQPLPRKQGWVIPAAALVVLAVLVIAGIFILPKIMEASQPALTQVLPITTSPLTAGQPTLSLSSQNQEPPSPAVTPTSSNNSLFYLYREDFNDPQFDGALPPNVKLELDWCSNLKVLQEKGSLTIQAPVNIIPGCYVGFGFEYKLSQIKAVEFALSSSPETPGYQPSIAFMLTGQDNGQKKIMLICGLTAVPSGAGCTVKKDQQDIYYTKSFIEKPGEIYTFRIEVLDPDKMTFRFLSNGDTIGEFTLPPADVPVYKDLNYNLGGGLVSMGNTTKTGLYFIDYLAIEQR